MTNESRVQKLIVFKGRKIRRHWNKKQKRWYFSIVDIITVLTNQLEHRKAQSYWTTLKNRLKEEGSELVTRCDQLKMQAMDGKFYLTDVADTETVLRLIQSVPSPNAEPFKLWLAKVGRERIDEINNPELAMERMRSIYEKKGYSKEWIEKRARGIAVRQDLTDEWGNRGVKNKLGYAILTNEIMQGAFDMKVSDYKKFKGLSRENLRDHMNDLELILTMLGEATTTKFTKDRDSQGFPKLRQDSQDGGGVSGRTRKDIEEKSGDKVISRENYLSKPESKKRLAG